MDIKFGSYIVHDNNDNGILDADIDQITKTGLTSTVATLTSEFPPPGSSSKDGKAVGITFDDGGDSKLSQEQVDQFLRKIGVDLDAPQSLMYDLKLLAVDYNWNKAVEYSEKGQIDASQKAFEIANHSGKGKKSGDEFAVEIGPSRRTRLQPLLGANFNSRCYCFVVYLFH